MSTGKSTVHGGEKHQTAVRRRGTTVLLIGIVVVSLLLLLLLRMSASPIRSPKLNFNFSWLFRSSFPPIHFEDFKPLPYDIELEKILNAASGNQTNRPVIITTLNRAWAEPNSVFELFLESFRVGENTAGLLRRLVVVCMDRNAYDRCSQIKGNHHCYFLRINGVDFSGEQRFMSRNYLNMMWLRIRFLGSVLQMGYSFLFTDADIMWLRNPFPGLSPAADFQIACDRFKGHPNYIGNEANGGFTFTKSNNRTILFYKLWHTSRQIFPGLHDQDVFNKIKRHPFIVRIGLRIQFLDTAFFGGFCQPGKDLELVRTIHANCCKGIENKVRDLRQVLDVWRKYRNFNLSAGKKRNEGVKISWGEFQNCKKSMGG